jgi:putative glycosyltransferase (TIGR04372 family)
MYPIHENRMIAFIKRQVVSVLDGGWRVFRKKCTMLVTLITVFFLVGLAIPIVVFIRLIRPIYLIRLGLLRIDRIGHLAWDLESYVADCDYKNEHIRRLDLFALLTPEPANHQLLKMWCRVLNVSKWVRPLYDANNLLPGGKIHEIIVSLSNSGYEYGRNLLTYTPVHIGLTSTEEAQGYDHLKAMGVPKDVPFICVHVRDSSYLAVHDPEQDYSYHNFRDGQIANYMTAVESLAEQGYYVLRLGAVAQGDFCSDNNRVIDYSREYRTDFLDIFLLKKCEFLIGTNTGVTDVADIFRKPVVKTNMTQFFAEIPLCHPKDIFIPKRIWLKREKRFMTLRELTRSPLWNVTLGEEYEPHDVELIENTPEEIHDAVIEMNKRLKGAWEVTEEDEEKQKEFWSIVLEAGHIKGAPVSHISAGFLRRFPEFLA